MDPTQNNAQPPSAPTAPTAPSTANTDLGLPPASGQNSELYNQIAGQDVEAPVVKKKGPSLLVTMMAAVMRFTLWLDSVRRTNERFFHGLGVIWTIFMSLLYFSGILVLIFAVYNRLQLPIYLEDQLHARNVEFETAEYGMDRIVVQNLHDKENTFSIDTMVIYSTFTDLLQKRIRLVSLDGLNIFVDAKSDFNLFKDIPALLKQIQNPTRGRLDVAVNAVTINNAKLTFKNQEVEVPLSFSMEGMYGDQTQIVLPMSINQPALQAKGTLTISGDRDYPEWTLSISEGVVTLPRSAPENISGDLKMSLSGGNLTSIAADFKLGYGTIEKHITANFSKEDEESLSGEVIWAKNNLTEQDLSSEMSFKIGKLILKNTSDLIITGPLTIDVKRLILANVALAGVQAPLTVDMHCKNWTSCLVSLTKEAMITIQDVLLQSQRQSIRSKESLQFIVKPQENMLVLQEENPYISYQIPLEKFAFEGKFEGADGNISIDAASMIVSGAFADEAAESSRLSVNAQNLSYEATGVLMKNANVSLGNVFQNSAHIQIDAEEAKLVGMPFLSNPFKLNLNMVGPQAAIRLDFKDAPIAVQMDGQLSLAQKAFAGQIRTNVIDLGKLTIPPQELFAGIPSSVKELSGSAVVYGQLKWMGAHSVGGPLNIGLKDVSFSTEETKVSGVNTVLTLDALQPLLVKQNQHVYVERINGLLPFQDIDILFQADNQNMRINQVSLLAAGVPVSLPPSVVALKNANMLVYLKNDKPIDAKAFAQGINLPDLEVSSGTANLSIPLELQNGVLSIPSVTLKMQSVLVERQSDEYENVFGTANHYYIRTGQIIMDENNVMQLALNGRLLPSKQTKDVQENNVTLPSDVFKEVALKGVPKDIQKRQHILFGE